MFGWFFGDDRRQSPRRTPIVAANTLTGPHELESAIHELTMGGLSDSGVAVSPLSAERLAAVAACLRVLCGGVAKLPLSVYRRSASDNCTVESSAPEHAALHRSPAPGLTAYNFWRMMMRDRMLRGNAFALQVRNADRRMFRLLRLHPDSMCVSLDALGMRTYTHTRADGSQVLLPASEVVHLYADSEDGIIGLSPVAAHRQTFGDGIALQQHGSRFFRNGARPSGVLVTDKQISPDSRAAMRADWERLYGGENSGRVAVLDQGVNYSPVSMTNEDAQYLESRRFNRQEIAAIYGVPPHKIADLDRATFTNIEHQSIEFVIDSLMPELTMIEQALNLKLFGQQGELYTKFSVDGLLRGDSKSRAEALQIWRRNGIISANEWRKLEDLSPRTDAGGDGYIVEANMRPDDGTNPNAQRQRAQ